MAVFLTGNGKKFDNVDAAKAHANKVFQQTGNIIAVEQKPIRYDIIDKQSGKVVGTAKTRAGATRSADRRDNQYGAYRYSVRAVYN